MTKKIILNYTSSIFDPLSVSAPLILEPRVIMPKMCLKKLGWDDEAPDELETCFIKWKINLLNCKALEIPGWYRVNNKGDIEVYIFSDAYICM